MRKVLLDQSITKDTKNFHYNNYTDHRIVGLKTHSINPSDFDYLYSGSYFFNFYINVLYKHFYLESKKFNNACYNEKFLECVNTARHICKFDNIKHLIFFDFDDLLSAPDTFLSQINCLQRKLNLQETTGIDFLEKRTLFFNTCVNTTKLHENFDNIFWVAFVLGHLMNMDIVPTDFSISAYDNQDLCKQFAETHYNKCVLNKVHHFETNIHLPLFLDK